MVMRDVVSSEMRATLPCNWLAVKDLRHACLQAKLYLVHLLRHLEYSAVAFDKVMRDVVSSEIRATSAFNWLLA
jgi:hypothetical protein